MIKQIIIAAGLACSAVSQTATAISLEPVYVDSPLTIHSKEAPRASRDFATRLQLDTSKLDITTDRKFVFIEDFPLDQDRRVTLQLEEASALASDATLIVMRHDDGGRLVEVEIPWPKAHMFRGTVVGEPTSDVFLAIGSEIANGWISIDGTRFIIGTRYADRMTLLYDEDNVPEGMIKWTQYQCGVEAPKEGVYKGESERAAAIPDECPQVRIAFDSDSEFTVNLFDGSETAAANYVETLVSSVSDIYKSSITVGGLGVRLKIAYLRLWSVSDDPWTCGDTSCQLSQFSKHWDTYMGGVDRHLAHLLCGRELGGGIANLFGLCNNGYAVSGGLAGEFPMPLEGEQQGNWDPIVFAHETGHNFGMIHTHEMEDPPDECGNGDCDNASGATIMSYCHLCEPNYGANIAFEFHDNNVDSAEMWLDLVAGSENCNLWPDDPPQLQDDRAFTDMNTPITIYILANDISNNCDNLSLDDFDERSHRGGTVTQPSSDSLTYTPTGTFSGTDSFTYKATNGSYTEQANVVVEISRPPSGGGGTDPIDPNDVIFVITLWGSRTADCTGDGTTNIDDLLAVLEGKAKPTRLRGKE